MTVDRTSDHRMKSKRPMRPMRVVGGAKGGGKAEAARRSGATPLRATDMDPREYRHPSAYVTGRVEGSELVAKVAWTGVLVVTLKAHDGRHHGKPGEEMQGWLTQRYLYVDVPKVVYEAFMEAPSKGQFYNVNVKGKYPVFALPQGVIPGPLGEVVK